MTLLEINHLFVDERKRKNVLFYVEPIFNGSNVQYSCLNLFS